MSEIVHREARETKARADIETGGRPPRNLIEEGRRRRTRCQAKKKPRRCRGREAKPQKSPLEEEVAQRENREEHRGLQQTRE